MLFSSSDYPFRRLAKLRFPEVSATEIVSAEITSTELRIAEIAFTNLHHYDLLAANAVSRFHDQYLVTSSKAEVLVIHSFNLSGTHVDRE